MWIADQWNDYEVIDCSKGEKLERWGDYLLVRPDPQVIWDTPKKNRGWKHMNGHYHRSKKGGGEWEFFDLPKQWQIHYKDLTFNLKPFNFKHTGLFPEQATNWDWFSDKIKHAGREIRRGNHYDAIIMDPPSYGRGPKGEIWKIEDSIHSFIKLCTKILSDDPLFFLVNSYTTGLAPAVLTYMLSTELAPWNGTVESQEIGLPVTESGLILPCGASGRWEAK